MVIFVILHVSQENIQIILIIRVKIVYQLVNHVLIIHLVQAVIMEDF